MGMKFFIPHPSSLLLISIPFVEPAIRQWFGVDDVLVLLLARVLVRAFPAEIGPVHGCGCQLGHARPPGGNERKGVNSPDSNRPVDSGPFVGPHERSPSLG